MPYKDPEKQKEYFKQYYEENKEKKKEYNKLPKGRKTTRITNWKRWGIIFHDYNLLYEIYINTTHCDECKCILNQCSKSLKCVDHDHTITDDNNVRNILCHSCNRKRENKKYSCVNISDKI